MAVGAIAGISLLVGATGILTMMWIAVGERTSEIGLVRALGATGKGDDANRTLAEIFRFLGGRFVASDPHPIALPVAAPPADREGRWAWFAAGTAEAAACVDGLWRQIMDKPA